MEDDVRPGIGYGPYHAFRIHQIAYDRQHALILGQALMAGGLMDKRQNVMSTS